MTSVYTELTKEAAKRGGPAALRAFYRMQGAAVSAAVAGVGVGGTWLYQKVRNRADDSAAAPVPETEREGTTDTSTPGEATATKGPSRGPSDGGITASEAEGPEA